MPLSDPRPLCGSIEGRGGESRNVHPLSKRENVKTTEESSFSSHGCVAAATGRDSCSRAIRTDKEQTRCNRRWPTGSIYILLPCYQQVSSWRATSPLQQGSWERGNPSLPSSYAAAQTGPPTLRPCRPRMALPCQASRAWIRASCRSPPARIAGGQREPAGCGQRVWGRELQSETPPKPRKRTQEGQKAIRKA